MLTRFTVGVRGSTRARGTLTIVALRADYSVTSSAAGRLNQPKNGTAATEAVFRPLSCLSPSRIAIKGVRDAVVCARRDGSRGDGASTAHVEHMFTLTPAEASREPSTHGPGRRGVHRGGMWGSIESADSSVLSAFPPSMYSKCMQRKGENKQRQRFVCLSRCSSVTRVRYFSRRKL